MQQEHTSTASMLRIGLIGHPVGHSRSPAMQQAALDALGILARYELWDTPAEALAARVASLREPNMLGANVTIPHKLAVVPLLDEVSPEALRVAGVVNTIVREESPTGVRLIGHNTDVAGLAATLRDAGAELKGRRVVLLGAGGSAQAVAGLAARDGAAGLVVAARRSEAAESLLADVVARLGKLPAEARALHLGNALELARVLERCDVLVNATSVGMSDASACPLDPALLRRMPAGAFVLDIVYTPPETALLRAAREAGLAAANGLGMLLHQGAASFALWTGREAPLEVMRAALG
jgi:shikimate dehydrogenase